MTRIHLLGHNEIVKLLLSAGADINAKTNKGNTPKDIAKEQSRTSIQFTKIFAIISIYFNQIDIYFSVDKQKTVDILVAAARKLNRTKINSKHE